MNNSKPSPGVLIVDPPNWDQIKLFREGFFSQRVPKSELDFQFKTEIASIRILSREQIIFRARNGFYYWQACPELIFRNPKPSKGLTEEAIHKLLGH